MVNMKQKSCLIFIIKICKKKIYFNIFWYSNRTIRSNKNKKSIKIYSLMKTIVNKTYQEKKSLERKNMHGAWWSLLCNAWLCCRFALNNRKINGGGSWMNRGDVRMVEVVRKVVAESNGNRRYEAWDKVVEEEVPVRELWNWLELAQAGNW